MDDSISVRCSNEKQEEAYQGLFGRWLDLILLGGGSVIALMLLMIIQLDAGEVVALSIIMLVLANFVNHPHFSYSYQMFYSLWNDVKTGAVSKGYQKSWWFAGVWVPCVLVVGLVVGAILWLQGNYLLLGVMLTSMGFFVGWHYVKQGFGMIIMDAALKKRYWPSGARKALLANAYCCWIAAFTFGSAGNLLQEAWGIVGIDFAVPGVVTAVACGIAMATTVWCVLELYRAVMHWRALGDTWEQMPLAGLVAYCITLYLWLGLIQTEPSFIFVIPFFHSLQYLAVVSRYKLNEAKLLKGGRRKLLAFFIQGVVIGALGFWIAPGLLDYFRTGELPSYRQQGVALAIGCAWIFINVHHYFIDSVLWRKENIRVNKYLFKAV